MEGAGALPLQVTGTNPLQIDLDVTQHVRSETRISAQS